MVPPPKDAGRMLASEGFISIGIPQTSKSSKSPGGDGKNRIPKV